MTQYLLNPEVRTCECKMLTTEQFSRLLKRLKSKKFGSKIVAVDVEEITTGISTRLQNRFNERVNLIPGTYFNVHVEYVI